jgi:hypothetical protein
MGGERGGPGPPNKRSSATGVARTIRCIRIRRLLLVGAERLDQPGWARLHAGLERGDPLGEPTEAWLAIEKQLRAVYLTDDLDQAIGYTSASKVKEVKTLAKSSGVGTPRSPPTT